MQFQSYIIILASDDPFHTKKFGAAETVFLRIVLFYNLLVFSVLFTLITKA